jgi:hypothetical protein
MKEEKFRGVDYRAGNLVDELKTVIHEDMLAKCALGWILMFDASASRCRARQTRNVWNLNYAAPSLPPRTKKQLKKMKELRMDYLIKDVHHVC